VFAVTCTAEIQECFRISNFSLQMLHSKKQSNITADLHDTEMKIYVRLTKKLAYDIHTILLRSIFILRFFYEAVTGA